MHNGVIYAIANQKGGIGKTTTALALSEALTLAGYRVLLIDADPQANATATAITQGGNSGATLRNVLLGEAPAQAAIVRSEVLQCDVLPAAPTLAAVDKALGETTGKEYRMRETLEAEGTAYDYIVIDTPPALNILTINALTAAQRLIIPTTADSYALSGIGQLYNTYQAVKKYCNPQLEIAGILITRHSGRTVLARTLADMIQATAAAIGTRVFNTVIREGIAAREAQSERQGLLANAARSNPAQDYKAFADEIIRLDKGEQRHEEAEHN